MEPTEKYSSILNTLAEAERPVQSAYGWIRRFPVARELPRNVTEFFLRGLPAYSKRVAIEEERTKITYDNFYQRTQKITKELVYRDKIHRVAIRRRNALDSSILQLAALFSGKVVVPLPNRMLTPPPSCDLILERASASNISGTAVYQSPALSGRHPAFEWHFSTGSVYRENHRQVLLHHQWAKRMTKITAKDRIAQLAPVGSILSSEQLLLAVLSGSTAVFPPTNLPGRISSILRWLETDKVSVLIMQSSLWQRWMNEPDRFLPSSLRLVAIRGKQPSSKDLQKWFNLKAGQADLVFSKDFNAKDHCHVLETFQADGLSRTLIPAPGFRPVLLDRIRQPVQGMGSGELFLTKKEQDLFQSPFQKNRLIPTGYMVEPTDQGHFIEIGNEGLVS